MNVRSLAIAVALVILCIGCSKTDAPPSSEVAPGAEETVANDAPQPTTSEPEASESEEQPAPPTEEELSKQVQSLYASGKFDEAETRFAEVREVFPDSIQVKEIHGTAAAYLQNNNRLEEAFTHLQALTDAYMENNFDRTGYTDLFGWRLGQLAQLADTIEGGPSAEDVFADYRSRAEKVAESKPFLADIVATQWAVYLSGQGRHAEAGQLVEPIVTKAREQLAGSPADAAAILGVADALEAALQVESAAKGGGNTDAARKELLDYLSDQAKSHPELDSVRQRFVSEHLNNARSLAYTDPEAASALLERLGTFEEEVIAPLENDDLNSKWEYEAAGNRLSAIEKSIEESRQRFALIGTPAVFPEGADGWVLTDSPIDSEQLRGKVVLLDFFAVWCGPCIATFPHLRAWHDEFADDGLQIIGVSEYHSFDWDPDAKRPKRVSDLEPAAEQAAMAQFAAHHELAHPIAFTPDDELQKHYVLRGIPHVVLIDRAGKVRMHRIGSGERNANDLEKAIKECLAEPIPSAAQGG